MRFVSCAFAVLFVFLFVVGTNNIVFFISAVGLALLYAFWNGANDRPNSIATVVATGALSYHAAILLAGILNFLGPFLTTAVAKTIAKGIVPQEFITPEIIIAGLAGATAWSELCTRTGIPVSITHSLIGGIMGAGISAGGIKTLNWDILANKVFIGIILAPLLGFMIGGLIFIVMHRFLYHFCKKSYQRIPLNNFFKKSQIVTSSLLSFGHGMNDGQNAIGIIALAYFTAGFSESIKIDTWMIFLGAVTIGIGTYIAGIKVMLTTGWKLSKLEPDHGAAAELAAAVILFFKSRLGMPVSTTHVALSAIAGSSAAQKFSRIRLSVAKSITVAWVITIPAAATMAGIIYFLIKFIK
jgi:PiT family inorganic phosphate transporter